MWSFYCGVDGFYGLGVTATCSHAPFNMTDSLSKLFLARYSSLELISSILVVDFDGESVR